MPQADPQAHSVQCGIELRGRPAGAPWRRRKTSPDLDETERRRLMTRSVVILAVAALAAFASPAARANRAGQRERPLQLLSVVPTACCGSTRAPAQVSLCAKKDDRLGLQRGAGRAQRRWKTRSRGCSARTAHSRRTCWRAACRCRAASRARRRPKAARAEPEGAVAERRRDRSRDERVREDVAPPRRHGAEVAEQRQNLSAADTDPMNALMRATASSRWLNGTLTKPWQAPG